MSGTSPGLRYRGLRIPLNFDPYFRWLVRFPNQGWFTSNLGRLDAAGQAEVILAVPPGAYDDVVGLDHAFVERGPSGVEHVSNAVPLRFGPRR